MTYGLLFWGNSLDSIKIFRLQKKIIRMTGFRHTDSCRKFFINLEILPLPSQYIFSLLMLTIRNRTQFVIKSEIHHINTRQHTNFHLPSVNVAKYQKGVYYLGVKLFNALLPNIIWNMASEVERCNSSLAINQFCQGNSITNEIVTGENSNVALKASSVYVKLDELQNNLSELIHVCGKAEN
jgi:hypothetical protein